MLFKSFQLAIEPENIGEENNLINVVNDDVMPIVLLLVKKAKFFKFKNKKS